MVREMEMRGKTIALLGAVMLSRCSGCGDTDLEGDADSSVDSRGETHFDLSPEPDVDPDTWIEPVIDTITEPDAFDVPAEDTPPTDCILDADITVDTSHWILRIGGPDDEWFSSVATRHDGSIVAAGTHGPFRIEPDFWFVTIDGEGNILEQKVAEGATGYAYPCVIHLSDCGILLAGITSSFGAGGKDVWIARLDSVGSVVWQKTIGGTGDDYRPAIIETADGGFFMSALTDSFSSSVDLWLLKLGSDASVVWQIAIGGDEGEESAGRYTLAEALDGTLYVVAHTMSFGPGHQDVWILSLGSAGNVIWQRAMGDVSYEYGTAIVVDDLGLTFVGQTAAPTTAMGSAWIVRLGLDGRLVWQRAFQEFNGGGAVGLAPRGDGGYLITGHQACVIPPSNLWVASINPDGTMSYQKCIRDDAYYARGCAIAHHHGGLVFAGNSEPSVGTTAPEDAIIARLGLDSGFTGACSPLISGASVSTGLSPVIVDTDAVPRATSGIVQDAHAVFRDVSVPAELICPE